MEYLIATHNKGKRAELARILSPLGIEVRLPGELGIDLSDPDETADTFLGNARIKALNGLRASGLPCIADDSGLCVDALGGRPGLYTARYGGEEMPYPDKIQKLIGELDGVPAEKRGAHFTCCICCVFPDGHEINAEGRCDGSIGFQPAGESGFGFDPIFYRGGRSFAQLDPAEKDAVSHRGNALRAFAAKLEEDK